MASALPSPTILPKIIRRNPPQTCIVVFTFVHYSNGLGIDLRNHPAQRIRRSTPHTCIAVYVHSSNGLGTALLDNVSQTTDRSTSHTIIVVLRKSELMESNC